MENRSQTMEWRLEADPAEDPLHPDYEPREEFPVQPFADLFVQLVRRARRAPTRESYSIHINLGDVTVEQIVWRNA
jgi:hypothetical protein